VRKGCGFLAADDAEINFGAGWVGSSGLARVALLGSWRFFPSPRVSLSLGASVAHTDEAKLFLRRISLPRPLFSLPFAGHYLRTSSYHDYSSRWPQKLTFWGRKRKADTRCTFTKPKHNNHCSSRCALLWRTTKLHPPARTHILVHFSGKGAVNFYLCNTLN
jgi:hypothetical protein